MDPRSQERPQGDLRQPGTSQEGTDKTQGRDEKKRKCCFSAEEHEILVREVMEHQHQLFITSKLPIGRREVIWQQIVDKINSVAEVRRTVTECMKRWHDCKRRRKEKMARNKKAALQTRGGSPAPQEDLGEMEEMVAAVIPEEIVTGIAGQDSADYQETTHMEEDDGSPVDLPVLDYPDDLDDQLTTISQETLQDVLGTLQTPPPVARRSIHVAAIPEDPPTIPIVRPAISNTAEDSDDNTATTLERTVVGVQRELAKEDANYGSLEGMRMCMMKSAEDTAAKQVTQSLLHGIQQCVRDLTTAVREFPQHMPSQSCCCMHDNKQDSMHRELASLRADMAAYHRDVAAILNNHQHHLAAVMPHVVPQMAADGNLVSTSPTTEVCVAPSNPPPSRAEETTHTSEDEDVEQIIFTHRSTR
ncbi:hypothetical protein NDU88_008116 [Pleurodeles waltl]|uniref:Myb-like domain-containing protein n=1 Tax=Pleurodeles waltl TaxID=8319 RepID=A0AAV7QNS8_PLEWA|nr:hypothetical protein NDU88_008116 [Pleurodeles waltl]